MSSYAIAIMFFIYFGLGFCAAIVLMPPRHWPTSHVLAHWIGWITAWPVGFIGLLIIFYIFNSRWKRQERAAGEE